MQRARILIGLSALIAIADAFLKAYAIKRLPEAGARFDSIVAFALHRNEGIAFNIPIPLAIVIPVTLLISALLVKTIVKHRTDQPLTAAFAAVILLGALGNLGDRIINGFTTDYIILFSRTAINLSDILIVIGTFGFLIYTETKENR